MNVIADIPVLLKTFIVFSMVLALNSTRLKLSTCLFVGTLVLGVWTGMSHWSLAASLASNLASAETINLALIVILIMVLSRLMKDSGQLDRIVDRFGGLTRDPRTTGAVMPSLIGLLPMPGGALFSAPMVETAFCNGDLSCESKTAVNYWFRHMWEYWWPLYPGVVLAIGLLGVEVWQFIAVMLPMTGATVVAGVVFLLWPIGKNAWAPVPPLKEDKKNGRALRRFLWEVMPIVVVVAVIIVMAGAATVMRMMGAAPGLPGGVSVLPGLAAALAWVVLANRIAMRKFFMAATDKDILPMVLLVVSIMLFKGIMTDSQAVDHIRDELVAYRFSLTWIIVLIPFLSGVVTGLAVGFVGTAFPLVIPLFPDGTPVAYLSYACLAYASGYMGMMLSPVHLCFLVTKDYFRASLLRSYRFIILPVIAVFAFAWLYFLALNNWIGPLLSGT